MVERELRERARRRSTYWVRGIAAFVATGFVGFLLMFLATATSAPIGHGTMETLAWLAFPFVLLEGLRNTADSLSVEKREGTLGLLFLTDLKGYDVVLGKFFAASLTSFYALLAIVPALAVPVLLGGVTGAEFWRLVLVLINALFFSLTAGTFISAISRDERKAWTGTFALVAFFVIGLPALGSATGANIFWKLSLYTPFKMHSATFYSIIPSQYWTSLCLTHAISWCWLALASFLLPRVWQESESRHTVRERALEQPGARRGRNEMLAVNPVWWLTSRNTRQKKWLWVCVIFISTLGVIWWNESRGVVSLWAIFGCAILFHLVLAVWVAFEACNSFADARGTGALELLLSTPISVRQILRGQHLALRELFVGPIILLLAVEACLIAGQVWMISQNGASGLERVLLVLLLGFCLVWFVLDLFAVAEVGMWFGLTAQKPTQALTRTILLVLVAPLFLLMCCWPVGPGVMIAKSVIFFTWAQSKLENQFRRAATERYDLPRTSKWRRAPKKLRMPGGP
jgi:ABC-type transport system involved in multi-copper enzyme maturation permease subunit